MQEKITEGIKFDKGKNRLELLPWEALVEVGKIVTFGANKYGDYNWLKGMAWSRFYGASLRHLASWINGEDKDSETNLSHLAHAACCILFLLSYELLNIGEDDRWKKK